VRRLIGRRIFSALLVVFASLLAGCSVLGHSELIWLRRAIALEANQSQAVLSKTLRLDQSPISPDQIRQLQVQQREFVQIDDQLGLHLVGCYQLGQFGSSSGNFQFDLYLQRQTEGKTWRLVQPVERDGEVIWVTRSLLPYILEPDEN